MKKNKKKRIYIICFTAVIWLFGTGWYMLAQQKMELVKQIEEHKSSVYIFQENITDPFIQLGADGYYYLTGTLPANVTENKKPFIRFWRSKDLIEWESYGDIEHNNKSTFVKELYDIAENKGVEPKLKAPKAHFLGNRWAIVHSSNVQVANVMLSSSPEIKSTYTEPLGLEVGFQVDPTIFIDDDATPWLLSNCTQIRKIKKDFSGFDGGHKLIGPKNRQLGFEGTRMVKVGKKYVLFGTSWSTDIYGKGTYNLYYSTSDDILGPYSSRKFAGRFLGNGSPFQDKEGRWWALAFQKDGQVQLDRGELVGMDLSNAPYTINKKGVTLVPLDVRLVNEEVVVEPKDSPYALPGKEEEQQF